jgi:hypothetical protein
MRPVDRQHALLFQKSLPTIVIFTVGANTTLCIATFTPPIQ